MSFFKSLFGMPKIVQAAIDSGDALVFTNQEKKELWLKTQTIIGPQNLARRYISLVVTVLWAGLTVVGATMIIGQHSELGAFADLYTKVSLVFGGIMAFYFGVHVLREQK